MMSGPDPYGTYGDSGDYYSPDLGVWYPDYPDSGPSVTDLISQGIYAGQVIGAGYPPGSNVTYAPSYSSGGGGAQQTMPYPQLMQPQTQARPQTQGIQLSNTTLMLLVGGALLFMLGTKKGR